MICRFATAPLAARPEEYRRRVNLSYCDSTMSHAWLISEPLTGREDAAFLDCRDIVEDLRRFDSARGWVILLWQSRKDTQ